MKRFWCSFALLVSLATGCADKVIPNTDVEDTQQNREVLDFMERYRRAVEKRDIGALLALASPGYFDDHGTPNGKDDTDFGRLKEQLTEWKELVKSVRYEIRYRKIEFKTDRVLVAFTYSGSFELNQPTGESKWARRLGDHRIELTREGKRGPFRITSGM